MYSKINKIDIIWKKTLKYADYVRKGRLYEQ